MEVITRSLVLGLPHHRSSISLKEDLSTHYTAIRYTPILSHVASSVTVWQTLLRYPPPPPRALLWVWPSLPQANFLHPLEQMSRLCTHAALSNVQAHSHIHTRTHTHIHVHVHVHTHTHAHTHTSACTHTHTHTHTSACTHTHTHTHTYKCMYTHTHTHTTRMHA